MQSACKIRPSVLCASKTRFAFPFPRNSRPLTRAALFYFPPQITFENTLKTFFEPDPGNMINQVLPFGVHALARDVASGLLPETKDASQESLSQNRIENFVKEFKELIEDYSYSTTVRTTVLGKLFSVRRYGFLVES